MELEALFCFTCMQLRLCWMQSYPVFSLIVSSFCSYCLVAHGCSTSSQVGFYVCWWQAPAFVFKHGSADMSWFISV